MLNLPDTAELAAELSAIDGLDLTDAHTIATVHLRRITSGAGPVCTNCGAYGHTAIDCPEPPLPRPSRVNWSDRERCGYCCGPHATADCRLRRPVFVAPEACGNCGGAHSTQRCPEVWQALRAPAPDTGLALIIELLHLARRELAESRAAGLHSAASGVIGDTLCAVEAWLDPGASLLRDEHLAAQRELVRATLAERVVLDGIAVPF